MDWLFELISPQTVTGRAIVGVGALLIVLVLLIAVTAVVFGLKRSLAIWVLLIAGLVAALVFLPVSTDGLGPNPDPTATYEAAMARFDADKASETTPLNPLCSPQLLGHGSRTDKVVVLIHGVSSCPQAFVDFAPLLFERGHNVLVMRLPQNGFADRATDALGDMTAEELAEFGDTSVDIATGLGEEVVVLGISAGGTVASWAAQNRADVDRAVLLAPFLGLSGFGTAFNKVLMRAMLLLPDFPIWKDPALREDFVGMPHAYQLQSTRGTGEIMRLALAVFRQAMAGAPAAGSIAVVTNDADTAVSNEVTDDLVAIWRDAGADPTTYVFAADHGLGHELIDPLEPGADPALTYPVIIDIIEGGDGTGSVVPLGDG